MLTVSHTQHSPLRDFILPAQWAPPIYGSLVVVCRVSTNRDPAKAIISMIRAPIRGEAGKRWTFKAVGRSQPLDGCSSIEWWHGSATRNRSATWHTLVGSIIREMRIGCAAPLGATEAVFPCSIKTYSKDA